jgi:hypothetical protein
MTIEAKIQEAIATGEVLTIRYQGGTQPGTIRNISPIRISGDKVRARCLASNVVKTFVISKIELSKGSNDVDSRWDPTRKDKLKYEDLNSFIEPNKAELEKMGWHVNFSDNHISLHRSYKNGRVLKGSDVSLSYDELVYEFYIDFDGKEHKEAKKRQKPWVIHVKGHYIAGYSKLERAIEKFLNQAIKLSPNKG